MRFRIAILVLLTIVINLRIILHLLRNRYNDRMGILKLFLRKNFADMLLLYSYYSSIDVIISDQLITRR